MNFTEFGFDDRLLDGIDAMRYEKATPIQEEVIPPIIEGRDIMACAQTGTGKTAAFLLPVMHKLLTEPHHAQKINSMVIVPTRELAVQISQTLEGISYFTNISSIAVYGGGSGANFAIEKKALSSGVDMVICTPGRMIAHLNMGYVKMDELRYLVLDEADRMLDMGFHDDIVKIISYLPKERQNLLFSATMPDKMRKLAMSILRNPVEVNIAISKPPEKIRQEAFVVFEEQKAPLIKDILRQRDFNSVVVFCSRKQNVKQLCAELKRAKLSVEQIHSDLEQETREQVLMDFRSHRLKILVATDILSRGIDIEDIDLVINYDVPNDGEDYVHRIGRTARAAAEGTAYTFISPKEQNKFRRIEQLIGREVTKAQVEEKFGPTPAYQPGGGGGGKRRPGGGGQKGVGIAQVVRVLHVRKAKVSVALVRKDSRIIMVHVLNVRHVRRVKAKTANHVRRGKVVNVSSIQNAAVATESARLARKATRSRSRPNSLYHIVIGMPVPLSGAGIFVLICTPAFTYPSAAVVSLPSAAASLSS
ncbi:DEAD/DEAH box helicase [Chitinophaga horti]|uniref:DEAD/DEAH box helicase n=1 Tax=Chitinophaga horti TaxID=2920382 RepID=A0ABY6J7T9_9BACT|nr:DEAD/DEAH box helicase [Chitinophaga horti]UYQ94642.1 DEAD/DEAH box helicase [Chitinophaga horti]